MILPPAEQDSGLSLPQLLTLIWAVVGFSILLTVELRHLLNRRRYCFYLPLPESTDVPAGLRVRMLEGLSSPLTYGLFRPTVKEKGYEFVFISDLIMTENYTIDHAGKQCKKDG